MKAFIVTTFIGCFGIDENNKILEYVEFPNDPQKIAEKFNQSKISKIEEENRVEDFLKKKGFTKIEKMESEFIKNNLFKLAQEKKFVKSRAEFNQFVSKISIELTKIEIKKAITRDNLIIQANSAVEELDKSINILIERLREWYGLHFPEMDKIIEDNNKFVEIVEKFGSREKIEHEELSHFRDKSMGIELSYDDVTTIQLFAKEIKELYDLRNKLSKYSEDLLKEVAPNLKDLAGPVLAAKLISLAGGLEKLARMPSSTIQLLGAEKALFRHLHGQGKSPKHGIIIMHPFIQNVPIKHRGKLARLIASKLSIAAKMDFYSKTYKGKELKRELENKIKEVLKAK